MGRGVTNFDRRGSQNTPTLTKVCLKYLDDVSPLCGAVRGRTPDYERQNCAT